MTVDEIISAELAAERAIRDVLRDLQSQTGRLVEWVKVEVRDDLKVTVNTISK